MFISLIREVTKTRHLPSIPVRFLSKKQFVPFPTLSFLFLGRSGEEGTVRWGKNQPFLHIDELTDGIYLAISFFKSHSREVLFELYFWKWGFGESQGRPSIESMVFGSASE